MIERFICIDRDGLITRSYITLEDAQECERENPKVVGIIRIVVENGKIKHCHEVGSVDP